jgi:two-component system, cell cycle sensor histidine kinase and response regulator CckA
MATGEAVVSAEGGQLGSRELVHEFRNLLAVIVNYCELIADETNDPAAIKADLQEIRVAAERALILTEKIPVLPRATSVDESPSDSS